MHGNVLNKNKSKLFLTANSDLAGRITILENNVYKITYYEIISGATGTLTVPSGATINAGEFSGANCVLSEIDGSNKVTWISPENASGNVVTATLNTSTGAWVKSGVTVSANVALIYSVNITGANYANLNNFYISDETALSIRGGIDSSQVAYGSGEDTITGSSLFTWSGTILKLGSTAFTSSLSSGIVQIEGTDVYYAAQSTNVLGSSGFRFGQNNSIYGTLQSQGTAVSGSWTGTSVARTSATELIAGGTSGANNMILAATKIYGFIGTTATNFGYKLDSSGFRVDQIQNLHTANAAGVTFGSVGTNGVNFQGLIGTTTSSALYMNQPTPSSSNYTLFATAAGQTVLNGTDINFRISNNNRLTLGTLGHFADVGQGTAGTSQLRFSVSNKSNETAGTNVPKMLFTIGTLSWATGSLAAADFVQWTQPSVLFTGASTATLAATLAINGAPIASTNASITTSVGLLVKSGSSVAAGTTTAYGAYFNAPTGATNNYSLGVAGGLHMINGRIMASQGADVASANNLSLGLDGNSFEITGTTQINLISNVGWQNGSEVNLVFTSTPTVKHNQATSGTNITIQLSGAVDFVATAGDTLKLALLEVGGTQAWRQVGGAVI